MTNIFQFQSLKGTLRSHGPTYFFGSVSGMPNDTLKKRYTKNN